MTLDTESDAEALALSRNAGLRADERVRSGEAFGECGGLPPL